MAHGVPEDRLPWFVEATRTIHINRYQGRPIPRHRSVANGLTEHHSIHYHCHCLDEEKQNTDVVIIKYYCTTSSTIVTISIMIYNYFSDAVVFRFSLLETQETFTFLSCHKMQPCQKSIEKEENFRENLEIIVKFPKFISIVRGFPTLLYTFKGHYMLCLKRT